MSSMKRIIIILAAFLITSPGLFSQSKSYNIVFDITTGDTSTHARVLRWAKGIVESHPDAKVEIVFYGRSLDMVVNGRSTLSADVTRLASEKKISFVACEHAMKVFNIKKEQLLDGIATVPDALYELIAKQAEGYGYIKVVPN